MRILFNQTYIGSNNTTYPSFQMKKSELCALDRHVLEKFLPKTQETNVQTFKVIDDFYKVCQNWISKINVDSFKGQTKETQIQRRAMLHEWFDYVTEDDGTYTKAIQLMILKSITKELKPNDNTLPPVLNKGVLADTITQIEDGLKNNEKALNFSKQYRINLQKSLMDEETALDPNLNGWIVIPSYNHDPKNFEANVDKLKMLSHHNWCTKSYKAEPYLKVGDFHVYMEQGRPKLGVRFVGDSVREIQGEKNNSKIPLRYYDIAKSYLKDFKLGFGAEEEISTLESTKSEADEILKKFPNGINNYPAEKIFEITNILCRKDKDGLLVISHYQPYINYHLEFDDLGIDENRLFQNIKEIVTSANFSHSNATNLGKLQCIHGDAFFDDSKVTKLGDLRLIGGNANFVNTRCLKSLENIEEIGGDLTIQNSNITDLGKLKIVKGNMNISWSKIQDLGLLEEIGKEFSFYYTAITSFKNIRKCWSVDFSGTNVTDLGACEEIDYADFCNSKITDLKNIRVLGFAIFTGSKVDNIGKLERITDGCNGYGTENCLAQLKKIKDNIRHPDSTLEWALQAA